MAYGRGNGFCVPLHGVAVFGLNHDAGQRFGAGLANDDPATVVELLFGRMDCRCHSRNSGQGQFFADLYIENDLGKDLEVCRQLVDSFAGAGDELEDYE